MTTGLKPLSSLNFSHVENNQWLARQWSISNKEGLISMVKEVQTRGLEIVFNNNTISTKKNLIEIIIAYAWGNRSVANFQYNRGTFGFEKGLLITIYRSQAALTRAVQKGI